MKSSMPAKQFFLLIKHYLNAICQSGKISNHFDIELVSKYKK